MSFNGFARALTGNVRPRNLSYGAGAGRRKHHGKNEDQCAALLTLSDQEYQLVPAIAFGEPIHYSELKRRGIEAIYGDEFERIRQELRTHLPLPADKLIYVTPLYDFGYGHVPAVIGEGFVTERV